MTEKQCTNCGEVNSSQGNFCSNCSSSEFQDIPPGLASRLSDRPERQINPAVRIRTGRLIWFSALSGGLYVFYWFYLTWKQLAAETNETHHPVWHALTLFVPIYGLFRVHAHARVIGELATARGLTGYVAPGLAVVLALVASGLRWAVFRGGDYGTLIILVVLGTVVWTTLVVLAQAGLNGYWEKSRETILTDARISVGEVVIVVIGALSWIATISPRPVEF